MPDLPAIRAALNDADPDDRNHRLILADAFDAQGKDDPRGMILRHACDIHERIGNITFPDQSDAFWTPSEGWATVATELETLAAAPEDTPAFRDRYQRLIRGGIPLHPENLEATLRLQYDLQVRLLSSLNLLEGVEGGPFITAIDGRRYPMPAFEDVLANMQTPRLQQKLRQGFDTLLLVPFGLPLARLLVAWQQGLRPNASTLSGVGTFTATNPLWVLDAYQTEILVYDPQSFSPRHGGRTKEQLLAQYKRGWDVLLVEGALEDLPREGQGQTINGRTQIECEYTPDEYLEELHLRHEISLTPESYILHFLGALECRGRVLDVGTYTYLPGAFLPTSRYVPSAFWFPEFGEASLYGDAPGLRYAHYGVRAAVRVD